MAVYRSPYERIRFCATRGADLRCDFELLTDKIASGTGLLRAQTEQGGLRAELLWCARSCIT